MKRSCLPQTSSQDRCCGGDKGVVVPCWRLGRGGYQSIKAELHGRYLIHMPETTKINTIILIVFGCGFAPRVEVLVVEKIGSFTHQKNSPSNQNSTSEVQDRQLSVH